MAEEVADTVVNVAEPEKEETVSRFLRSRTRQMPANDYHPTHSKEALADIPDVEDIATAATYEDKDREEPTMTPSKYQLTDEDAAILKQEITHLSFETTLKIFAMYHYNLKITIAAAHEMVAPQLMPNNVKEMFVANIPIEREQNPTKKTSYKSFYMAKPLRKVVNNKTLVDFYYSEKNREDGNWRLEHEDMKPMESDERIEMEEKMQASGITIVRKETGTHRKHRRHRKHRKNNNPLRPESSLSKERNGDDADSDSGSVDSTGIFEKSTTETPAPMAVATTSAASEAPVDAEPIVVDVKSPEIQVDVAPEIAPEIAPEVAPELTPEVAVTPIAEVVDISPVVEEPVATAPASDATSPAPTTSVSIEIPEEISMETAPPAVTTCSIATSPVAMSPVATSSVAVEIPMDIPMEIPVETIPPAVITTCSIATSPIMFEAPEVAAPVTVSKTVSAGTSPIPMDTPPMVEEKTASLQVVVPPHETTPPPMSPPPHDDSLTTPEPKSSSSSSSSATTTSESSTSASSTTSEPEKLSFKFRFSDILNRKPADTPGTSSSSSSSSKKHKKKYRKKTIEELRGGVQKIYPDRERKAKKFFDTDV